MAAHKETSWPSDGTLVTAYKENLMTAVTPGQRLVAPDRVQQNGNADAIGLLPSLVPVRSAPEAEVEYHIDASGRDGGPQLVELRPKPRVPGILEVRCRGAISEHSQLPLVDREKNPVQTIGEPAGEGGLSGG
jgi:hypothetical protein